MKKQRLQTKLTLKKQTIVSLNNNDMRTVKGGKIFIPPIPLTPSCESRGCQDTCSCPCPSY